MPPQRPVEPAPSSPLRQLVERRTRVLLVYLSQRPPWTLPLLTAALLLGGLFSPPVVGVPLLVLLLLLVGWLSYVSWPAVSGVGRPLRLGMLALLVWAIATRVA